MVLLPQPYVVHPDDLRNSSVGAVVGVLLTSLAWFAADAWSLVSVANALHPPNTIEDMTMVVTAPVSLAIWGFSLVAGFLWGIWQRKLAMLADTTGRAADPMWHLMAWFAPIVMWWEPLRNLRAVARKLAPQHEWLLSLWWCGWVVFRVSSPLVVWELWAPRALLLPPEPVAATNALALLCCTVLAVAIVTTLTMGAERHVDDRLPIRERPGATWPRLGLGVLGLLMLASLPVATIVVVSLLWGQYS